MPDTEKVIFICRILFCPKRRTQLPFSQCGDRGEGERKRRESLHRHRERHLQASDLRHQHHDYGSSATHKLKQNLLDFAFS
jgi:hypothetical protein